ncbi:MAG: LOG family protein [Actinomycetia bacterium]|nr:LOG family protein [Actinomycetes bacterium]
MHEIHSGAALRAALDAGEALNQLRLQGLDLGPFEDELHGRTDLEGLVVLGGSIPESLDTHLRRHGAIIFPKDPHAPVSVYRARLYHPAELYTGLATHGYASTPDAQAYLWASDTEAGKDTYVTMLRAIHDDAMSDALGEVLDGRAAVGVMGGHNLARGTGGYRAAAALAHALVEKGYLVMTGGGPGAMEAANLGAFTRSGEVLADALDRLAEVPSFRPSIDAWARLSFDVRRDIAETQPRDESPHSIGIPTWFYGHEPPNIFCHAIAKYFSNAEREDGLINRSNAGIVVLPGAAGTVQEIFQACTPLYYHDEDRPGHELPKLVLVGVEHWTEVLPAWPLVRSLAAGRPMEEHVHIVDDIEAALAHFPGPNRP